MASLILRNEEIEAAFNIEAPEGTTLASDCFTPNVIPDVYKDEFLRHKHHTFIGEADGGHVIFAVRNRPSGGNHKVLKITKKGTEEFLLDELTFRNHTLELLAEHVSKDAQNIYYIPDPEFRQEIASIEEKHDQRTDHLKIAVLYCKSGQKTPQEFFSNTEAPETFHTFVKGMGEQIELLGWNGYSGDMSVKKEGKTFYTKFQDLEVIYHVSVLMGAEGHRRLIGNDVCTIFFRDENSEPFDVTAVTNLGTMPQVFIVVQPKGHKYQVSSFSRKTIKPYPPTVPNHLFTLKEARQFILTKLHNGFIQATIFCPPLSRLWSTPRGALIDEIAARWPKETPKTQKARLKRDKEKYEKIRTDCQALEKKELAIVVIAGQNLAVRDTLAKSSDPYVVISCWDQQVKTKVLKMTLNPVWNEEVRLDLRGVDLTDAVITVTIMDWNLVSSHEFMGEAEVSCEDVIQDYLTKTEPVWLKLRARTSEFVSGEISMRFSLDGFLDPTADPLPDDPEWAKVLTGQAPKRGLDAALMPITGPKIKRASTPPKIRKGTLATSEKSTMRQSLHVKSTSANSGAPTPRLSATPGSVAVRSGSTPTGGLGHSASSESVPSEGTRKRSKSPSVSDRKRNAIDSVSSSPGSRAPGKLERSTSDDFHRSPTSKRKGSVGVSSSSDSQPSSAHSSRPSSPPLESGSSLKASASDDNIAEHPRVKGLASSGRTIKRTVSGGIEEKKAPPATVTRDDRAMSEAPRLEILSAKQVCENMLPSIASVKGNIEELTAHLTTACDNAGDPDVIKDETDKFAHLATATIRLAMAVNQSAQGIIVQQSLPFLVLKKRTVSQHSSILEQNVIALIRSGKALIHTASTTHAGPPLTPFNSLLLESKQALSNLSHSVVDLRDHI